MTKDREILIAKITRLIIETDTDKFPHLSPSVALLRKIKDELIANGHV